MTREQWKDQYAKAISICKDLYEYSLVSQDRDEILEYQMSILKLLANCEVRIKDTWSKRINRLNDIRLDLNFNEKLNSRVRSGMRRFQNYEIKRLNDKVQYFHRSYGILD